MTKITFLNEKHNPIPAVRQSVREQVINHIVSNTEFVSGPNGLYCKVAEDVSGAPIYACLDLTISLADPTVKREAKVKEKLNKEVISVPELF